MIDVTLACEDAYSKVVEVVTVADVSGSSDMIFVTNITNIISGEKIVMWRNFSFPCMAIVGKLKISPHAEKFQMSPHDRCGKI